jgi:hypothetical protein
LKGDNTNKPALWEDRREKDAKPIAADKPTKSQTKNESTPSSHKQDNAGKQKKEKTPKQKWSAYISAHGLASHNENDNDNANGNENLNENLAQEPSDVINQTESKNKYNLTPQDLACLPHFPKKNPVYGKTMKLFKESEVKMLAYRKAAVLAGVEGDGEEDEEAFLEKGREIFEKQGEDDEEDEE